MGSFLHEMFLRFSGAFKSWEGEEATEPSCSGAPKQAAEYVVDQIHSRLRFVPGYAGRLTAPVAATFRYIDELVEGVPGTILCSRSAYVEDPRVNAFFADPRHLQEVFSQNEEIRDLFNRDLEATECWALLCMKKKERHQLGMSLVGNRVRKDVMQTVVDFVDHQIYSPAAGEAEARRSLKCCIFNGMLAHIRKRGREEKIRVTEMENRRSFLLAQLHRKIDEKGSESRKELQKELQKEVDDLGKELAQEIPRLASPEYHLDLVAEVLGNPAQYVSGSLVSIHLSRLGVKLDAKGADIGNEIPLFEIRVASQGTRVGALVRFPRAELLPQQDFVHNADLFLAL